MKVSVNQSVSVFLKNITSINYFLFLIVRIHYFLGMITVSGTTNFDSTNSGGGSGGSIIIETASLEGTGSIRVNGGDAYGNGGGGGGGRMAVYWKDREWWFGSLQAFGGAAGGSRNGGPGSIYMQVRITPFVKTYILIIKQNGIVSVIKKH